MIQKHRNISDMFGAQMQRQKNGEGGDSKPEIEKEIRNRFNDSSNDFGIEFDDEEGSQRVKYEMTVVNKNDE